MAVPRRTKSQRSSTMQSCKGRVLCALVGLAVVAVLWTINSENDLASGSSSSGLASLGTATSSPNTLQSASSSSSAAEAEVESSATETDAAYASPLERKQINGVDVLLQSPLEKPPKALLFVTHGCSHSHTDFWPSTPTVCPECLGLPEEKAIVKMALKDFQFAVMAISSHDRAHKCWTVADGRRVAPAIKIVADTLGDKIPIFTFGASSGGNFVGGILVDDMEDVHRPTEGYISQIAAPDPRSHPVEEQNPLPAAVYITMNRDERTDKEAERIVESLLKENHPAKHIRLPSLPITDTLFHERIPEISLEQSKAMAQALLQGGFLKSPSQKLAQDPRKSNWRDVISPLKPEWDTLVADESAISEVMNVARGTHELTRDGVREAIEFVLEQYKQRGPLPLE